MTTKIIMIRHGESAYVNGQEKIRGLTKAGQVEVNKISKLLKDIKISAVYSSDYKRAIETVEPLSRELNIGITEMIDLRERLLKPEDLSLSYEAFLEAVKNSYEDPEFKIPGGESLFQAQSRAITVIEQLIHKHQGQNIVIGTHGNIMTMIMHYYDSSYGFEFWKSTSMPDIYMMHFEQDKLIAVERKWSLD